jgi:hypothetical protein
MVVLPHVALPFYHDAIAIRLGYRVVSFPSSYRLLEQPSGIIMPAAETGPNRRHILLAG